MSLANSHSRINWLIKRWNLSPCWCKLPLGSFHGMADFYEGFTEPIITSGINSSNRTSSTPVYIEMRIWNWVSSSSSVLDDSNKLCNAKRSHWWGPPVVSSSRMVFQITMFFVTSLTHSQVDNVLGESLWPLDKARNFQYWANIQTQEK